MAPVLAADTGIPCGPVYLVYPVTPVPLIGPVYHVEPRLVEPVLPVAPVLVEILFKSLGPVFSATPVGPV